MNFEKTLEQLSFFRVRDEIAAFCVSEEGIAEMQKRVPLFSKDAEKIAERKKNCAEWIKILLAENSAGIKFWKIAGEAIKTLKIAGSCLSENQAAAVLSLCTSALDFFGNIRAFSVKTSLPLLSKKIDSLPYSSLTAVQKECSRIIGSDGKIKDLAELAEIRREIAKIKSEIDSAIKKITSNPQMNQILETNVPTFRAERQVLAVKSSQRAQVAGIVHEYSSSGRTVYIEPEEAVKKGNDLVRAQFRLIEEERKILFALSEKIREFWFDLKKTLYEMKNQDCECAAAKWAIANNAAIAQDSQTPALFAARHPLLKEKCVPIEMEFLEGKRILVISGPNTGGKTVAIKTFALLSLLNQAGFPIPAKDGTRLKIFDSFFTDIGDEQSIDESLSTFSAHMKNIAEAARHANENSLVLLDEAGSGTDPQEGGAVIMAVLDALIERKSFVLLTTHHGAIKNYAHTHEECMNASAEFDFDSLSPTYRILMGVPGESHALEIAEKAGLPKKIAKKAKEYSIGGGASIAQLIKSLSKKHLEAENRLREISQQESKLMFKEQKILKKEADLLEKEAALSEMEAAKESRFVKESRSKIENLVRILKEGEITRDKNLMVRSFVDDLTQSQKQREMEAEEKKEIAEKKREEVLENGMKISENSNRSKSSKKTKSRKSNADALENAKILFSDEELKAFGKNQKIKKEEETTFQEGAEVLAGKNKMRGTIARKEKNGVWQVSFGSMKMSFKEKDLVLIGNPKIPKTADYSVELVSSESEDGIIEKLGDSPKFELRLLGMREEEAIKTLRRQLDLCVMKNLQAFSVIHGHGSGILRQAVQDVLSHYPGVKNFYFARAEDGGFGKTYVEMM